MAAATLPLLSPFGESAVTLDVELSKFDSLSKELERLAVESDKGLERGITLVQEINSCRERIEVAMRTMAKALSEVQTRHQSLEALIAERSALVESRRQNADSLFSRFKMLGDMVEKINDKVAELRTNAGEISEEDRQEIIARLPALDTQMGTLVEEARKLMEEAKGINMQFLERNVDALRKSLLAARNRIHLLVEKQFPTTQPVAN